MVEVGGEITKSNFKVEFHFLYMTEVVRTFLFLSFLELPFKTQIKTSFR